MHFYLVYMLNGIIDIVDLLCNSDSSYQRCPQQMPPASVAVRIRHHFICMNFLNALITAVGIKLHADYQQLQYRLAA
jgi:hypothetical protein